MQASVQERNPTEIQVCFGSIQLLQPTSAPAQAEFQTHEIKQCDGNALTCDIFDRLWVPALRVAGAESQESSKKLDGKKHTKGVLPAVLFR